MTNKTILIVGPSGPQGKTTLKYALKEKGYCVMELNELATYSNLKFAMHSDDLYHHGLRKGFVVINFTGKPFFKKYDLNYKIPENELQQYIDYIEKEAAFKGE